MDEAITTMVEQQHEYAHEADIFYHSKLHIQQIYHLVDCIVEDREPDYAEEERKRVHAVQCNLVVIRSVESGLRIRVDKTRESFRVY